MNNLCQDSGTSDTYIILKRNSRFFITRLEGSQKRTEKKPLESGLLFGSDSTVGCQRISPLPPVRDYHQPLSSTADIFTCRGSLMEKSQRQAKQLGPKFPNGGEASLGVGAQEKTDTSSSNYLLIVCRKFRIQLTTQCTRELLEKHVFESVACRIELYNSKMSNPTPKNTDQ